MGSGGLGFSGFLFRWVCVCVCVFKVSGFVCVDFCLCLFQWVSRFLRFDGGWVCVCLCGFLFVFVPMGFWVFKV